MDYRISWLAIEGGKDRLLEALGFVDTREVDEANEAPFSIAELPTGWSVVWANDPAFADERRAAQLSRAVGRTLAVSVNETCMHSKSALFEKGVRRWRLQHAGDERIDSLDVDGLPPPKAYDIETSLRGKQLAAGGDAADVDVIFDVPLDLAMSLCGYKHDRWQFGWGEPTFTVVMPAASAQPERR